ncbi:MAG: group II intron reverse transcriptase/maturase [Phycisphaerae bacterium]|nr:group II intron reverse transcriptase/maturase [Phycisphaerae bacterium]
MEQVVEQSNMQRAWSKVKSNKGAAGVDGLEIKHTQRHLAVNWPAIKEQLLSGRYRPAPVLRVEIPKAKGGTRKLGIPTVTDRLIQQAISQVLQPMFDPGFSESSFGFRPKRSAHMAVEQSQRYFNQGYRWVVDMDLEQFFDRVNHDILMSKIALKIKDTRLLGVLRRYLQAGVLVDGVLSSSPKGTPQGGPLSPLLSNIMLDELDKELASRGHKFSRYADDCNIYVKSQRAGKRVLESISKFLSNVLKLKVNESKSKVDRPWKRSFLGYTVTTNKKAKLKPSKESIKRFKAKVKVLIRIGRGRNLARFIAQDLNPLLRGWANYFSLSETKMIFIELDSWLRRKLRCIRWRQWKRPRIRQRKLIKRGLSPEHAAKSAYNGRGPWFNSGASHMNLAFSRLYFGRLNLISLAQTVSKTDWLK